MELWKEIELAQDKIRRVILHTPIQLGSQLGHNWCQSNWGPIGVQLGSALDI
jgi:hypothetical protein